MIKRLFLLFLLSSLVFCGVADAAITYNQTSNRIEVTGYSAVTPCTFLDIWTADNAATNGRQLYTGTQSGGSPFSISLGSKADGLVTTQPWVADSFQVNLKITCTARVGATCAITGKDRAGQAVTETGLDVSSGTATSTKKYYTCDTNGIVFTGLTNGDTITIKQDRWGLISKLSNGTEATSTNSYWMLESDLGVGDFSTTTGYLSSQNELIFTPGDYTISVGSNSASVFYIGTTTSSQPSDGSIFCHDGKSANTSILSFGNDSGKQGTALVYDTSLKMWNSGRAFGSAIGGTGMSTASIMKGIHSNGAVGGDNAITVNDINIYKSVTGGFGSYGGTLSDIRVHNVSAGYSNYARGFSDFLTGYTGDGTHNVEILVAYAGYSPSTCRLNDCIHADNKLQANGPSNTYRTTYVDMTVNDNTGVGISGASMTIKDMDGNIVSYNPAIYQNAFTNQYNVTSLVAGASWLTQGFAVGDTIVQDAEFMLITAIGGTGNKTATVTRGYYSKYPACGHGNPTTAKFYKVGSVPSNASGVMAQQIIPLKRYLRTAGSIGSAALTTTYKDHTIIITKAGYAPYTDVITFEENKLTGQDLEVALQPAGTTMIYDSTLYDTTVY